MGPCLPLQSPVSGTKGSNNTLQLPIGFLSASNFQKIRKNMQNTSDQHHIHLSKHRFFLSKTTLFTVSCFPTQNQKKQPQATKKLPNDPQRLPKASQRDPKATQNATKTPQDDQKSSHESITSSQGHPNRSPTVPLSPKCLPKNLRNTKKASLGTPFGAGGRGHSPLDKLT